MRGNLSRSAGIHMTDKEPLVPELSRRAILSASHLSAAGLVRWPARRAVALASIDASPAI